MRDNMVCRCFRQLECPSLALTESGTVAGKWGVELHALIRLSGSPPYLVAGDEEVRDDSLRMQALLLAEAVAVVVGENPAAPDRLLDDAAPQGIGVVVIGEVEHMEAPELDLQFRPCASFGFSIPPGNQRLQRRLFSSFLRLLGALRGTFSCPVASRTTA
mgnify:CR=1 FL=1